LPADPSADKALVQTLAGRLATYVAHFVGTGGALTDAPAPSPVLVEGFRIAMETIAREWRVGTGPAGVIQVEEGSTAQREIFANVRENRYVLRPDGATPRDARDLLKDPGVAATVIYRMANRAPWPDARHLSLLLALCLEPFSPGHKPGGHTWDLPELPGQVARHLGRAVLRSRAPGT